MAGIKEETERWENTTVKKSLQKFPERTEGFRTTSGITMKRLHTPADINDTDYVTELGFPGEYPFTRGVQPTMYRGRYWTMRQYSGFGTAEDTNRRYKYLLDQGQTGLSVAFDLPTQIGYDSDHPLSMGEVGKCGVAIDSLGDMEILFEGIPLNKVSTSMTINSTAATLLAMYMVVAEKQGVPPAELRGTIQNDILKEYIARGTYIYPPQPSMRIVTDIFAFCKDHLPQWNSISISGYHIREAGSSAVQEVAFTLADGIAYVDAAIRAGLDVDEFAQRLSFFFNCHNNFFEEIAKFRAARRLWAQIMKERFNAKKPGSCMLRFHTQTAGCTLTAQQPYNNVVRVAYQAMAAVLGGTQSLHTNSFDEALSLPSERAVQVALRTQQIIAEESGCADVVDPLGGSYYVESLTNEIEKRVQTYLDEIDRMGGSLKAIEKGYVQQEIANSAYEHQKAVDSGEQVIVGVNKYTTQEQHGAELLHVGADLEAKQMERLARLRGERNSQKVAQVLERVSSVAKSNDNIMPVMIEAAEAYATVGEVSDALRQAFGEYREHNVV